MDLEHRYFYEVCQTRNMTKAAHNLYVSQPALSTAIKKIEQRLGVELFDRRNNPLTLTEAGRIFLVETNKIRLAEQDLNHQLTDYKKSRVQSLYIGSSQYFNAYYLPPVLKRYRQLHPHVRFKITERNAQLLNKELYAGNVDVAIHCGEKANQLRRQAVQSDRLVLAVPKSLISATDFATIKNYLGHHKQQKKAVSILNHLPFVVLSSSNNLALVVNRLCGELHFTPQPILESYQLETAFHMACCGVGATFITNRIRDFAPIDGLYFADINRDAAQRCYYAYTRRNAYQAKRLREFIDLLKKTN